MEGDAEGGLALEAMVPPPPAGAKRGRSPDGAGDGAQRAKRRRQTAAAGGVALRGAAAKGRVRRVTVADLLPDLLCRSVSYLSGVEIATNVRRVCRAWAAHSRSNLAWQEVHRRWARLRAASQLPDPFASIVLTRHAEEVTEEEYAESVESYQNLFGRASQSMKADMSRRLEKLPVQPKDVEGWWWRDPGSITPVFRRARLMWRRLVQEQALREVGVGLHHIDEQLSSRNTFIDFQFAVGDLWLTDLYISVGFLPAPAPLPCNCDVREPGEDEPMCGYELHTHPTHVLLRAERALAAPKQLRLYSSRHPYCAGSYHLCKQRVNGYPCWMKEDDDVTYSSSEDSQSSIGYSSAASWLYSSPLQVWTFSNREGDFETGAGHIASQARHHGFLPTSSREWMHGDGTSWDLDETIFVRSVRTATDRFLSNQRHVRPEMRGVVVSWLSEVQMWTHGPLQLHAMFLATAVFDIYLGVSAPHSIMKERLQLVACAALVVACAAESPLLPGKADTCIMDRVVALSDKTYTKAQVKAMVAEIHRVCPDATRFPTVYLFLERYVERLREYDGYKNTFQYGAEFLAELANTDYTVVSSYRPAVLAAGCVLAATRHLAHTAIEGTEHLRLLDCQVEQCCTDVLQLAKRWRPLPKNQNVIREKYLSKSRMEVAKIFDALAEADEEQFAAANDVHPMDDPSG